MIPRAGRLLPLSLLAALGCAARATHVEPILGPYTLEVDIAEWTHELHIGSFEGYAPGEYCIDSSIINNHENEDEPGVGTVRYGMLVKVSSLGTTYVAKGEYGDETETFSIRLREGDKEGALFADFDHSVERHGKPWLRFAGTTVLSTRGFAE